MTELDSAWAETREVVRRAMRSTLHCSMATVNEDGSPHVTPIGSLALTRPGQAVYFDIFNRRLAQNLDRDGRLCIQVVDGNKRRFLGALLRGRFVRPVGLRLLGTAGPRREATPAEIERFENQVRPLLRTRGGRALWTNCRHVRDVTITETVPMKIGSMTR